MVIVLALLTLLHAAVIPAKDTLTVYKALEAELEQTVQDYVRMHDGFREKR